MSKLDDFNRDSDELDDIERAFQNSKGFHQMDNEDIDLAILSGDFDKPIPPGGCFKGTLLIIGITVLVIILFFIAVSILGHLGSQQYDFIKDMKK